jgi:hypothetical protein
MRKLLSMCPAIFTSGAFALLILAALAAPKALADQPGPNPPPPVVVDTCPDYNNQQVGCYAHGSCDQGSCNFAGSTCYCP